MAEETGNHDDQDKHASSPAYVFQRHLVHILGDRWMISCDAKSDFYDEQDDGHQYPENGIECICKFEKTIIEPKDF